MKTGGAIIETCRSLIADGVVSGGCCDSCHDDADEFGIPLEDCQLIDGQEASICCAIYWQLHQKGLLANPVHHQSGVIS
mgnify:CR=1 FL=1